MHITLLELINFSNSYEYLLLRKSLLGSGTVITITYASLTIIELFPFLMIMPPPQEAEGVSSIDIIDEPISQPEIEAPLPSHSSSSTERSVSPDNSLSIGYGSSTHLTDIEGTPKTPAPNAHGFTQISLPSPISRYDEEAESVQSEDTPNTDETEQHEDAPEIYRMSIPHLDLSHVTSSSLNEGDEHDEQSTRTEPESHTVRFTDSQRHALHLAMLDAWSQDNALPIDTTERQQTEQDEADSSDSDTEEELAQPSAPNAHGFTQISLPSPISRYDEEGESVQSEEPPNTDETEHERDLGSTLQEPESYDSDIDINYLPTVPHLDLSHVSGEHQLEQFSGSSLNGANEHGEQSTRTEPESHTVRFTDSQRHALHLAMLDAWSQDNALPIDTTESDTHRGLEQQTEQDESEIQDTTLEPNDIEDEESTTHFGDQADISSDSDTEEELAQPSAPATTSIPSNRPNLVEARFNADLHRLHIQLHDAKESLVTLRKQRQEVEKHLSYFAEITQAKKRTQQQESYLALDLAKIEARIHVATSEYARLMAYVESITNRIAEMESLTTSLEASLPMSARTLDNQQLQAPPAPLTARPPQTQSSIHSKQSRIDLKKAFQAIFDELSKEEGIFNQVKEKIALLKGKIDELQLQKEALSAEHEIARNNADGYRSTHANWEAEQLGLRANLPLLCSDEQRAHEEVKALKQKIRHKEDMRDALCQHKSDPSYNPLMPQAEVSAAAPPHSSFDASQNLSRKSLKLLHQFELARGILADLKEHILKLKILTKQLRASRKSSEIDTLIAKFISELSPICSRIDSIKKFKPTPSKDAIEKMLYKLKGEIHTIYDQLYDKALDCIRLYKQHYYRVPEREQGLYSSLEGLKADIDMIMRSIQQNETEYIQPCSLDHPTSSTSDSSSSSTGCSLSHEGDASISSSTTAQFTVHQSLNTQQIALMATQLGLSHQVIILSPVHDYMQLDTNYDITPPEIGIWNLMQDGEPHYYPALLNNHVVAVYIYNWQITVIDSLASHEGIVHQVAQAFDIDDSFVEVLSPSEGIQENNSNLINACAGAALAFLDYIHWYNENNAQDPTNHCPFYTLPHYDPLSTDQVTTLLSIGDAITDVASNGFSIMLALNHHMHAETVGNYISHTDFRLIYSRMLLQLEQLQEQ